MKKVLFFLTILIGVFGFFHIGETKSVITQQITDSEDKTNTDYWGGNYQFLGTGLWSNQRNNQLSIYLELSEAHYTGIPFCGVQARIIEGTSSEGIMGGGGSTVYYSPTTTAGIASTTKSLIKIPILYDFDPVIYYAVDLWTFDTWGCQYFVNFYGSENTTSFPNGFFSPTPESNIKDLWFLLERDVNSLTYNPLILFDNETQFATQYPVGCTFNDIASSTAATMTFPVIFNFTNASNSNITFTEIDINFYDSNGDSTTTIAWSNDIPPNTVVSYYENIVLPIGVYRIELKAIGYDINTGEDRSVTSGGTDGEGNICPCTSIGVGEINNIEACNWGGLGYLSCQNYLQNCIGTSTSWTDTILCRLESLAVGLICPTYESLASAKGIVTDVKGRFPLNYVNIFRSELSGFGSSTTATTSATTSYITGNLGDFSSGFKAVDFFNALRTIIGYCLILATTLWAIKFSIKNVLK